MKAKIDGIAIELDLEAAEVARSMGYDVGVIDFKHDTSSKWATHYITFDDYNIKKVRENLLKSILNTAPKDNENEPIVNPSPIGKIVKK